MTVYAHMFWPHAPVALCGALNQKAPFNAKTCPVCKAQTKVIARRLQAASRKQRRSR